MLYTVWLINLCFCLPSFLLYCFFFLIYCGVYVIFVTLTIQYTYNTINTSLFYLSRCLVIGPWHVQHDQGRRMYFICCSRCFCSELDLSWTETSPSRKKCQFPTQKIQTFVVCDIHFAHITFGHNTTYCIGFSF